ncbi:MAG: hypothetical protein HQL66_09550 [Magnetococcales bacterium]|nr:hypothetical protein [Magnetococcales bacterium]
MRFNSYRLDYGSENTKILYGNWYRAFSTLSSNAAGGVGINLMCYGSTLWTPTPYTGNGHLIADAVQIERGSGATTPIHTTSAWTSRASETCKWPSTGNLLMGSGTLVVEVAFPFLKDTSLLSSGTLGIISLSGNAASVLYYDFSAQAFSSSDGTHIAMVAAVPAREQRWRLAVLWDSTNNRLQLGAKNVTTQAAWSWGTATAYAGSFASNAFISLGIGIPEAILIANVMILRQAKPTSEIEARFP